MTMAVPTRTTLNEFQELLEVIREDAEQADFSGEIEQDLEDTLRLVRQSIQSHFKLKSLFAGLKSDAVDVFLHAMRTEGVEADEAISSLAITPVHLAAYAGAVRTLRHLSSLPTVSLNSKTRLGDTPLMFALYGANSDGKALCLLQILLGSDKPPDWAKRNNNYLVPLCVALQQDFTASSKFLMVPPLLSRYDPVDLLRAVKIALLNNRDDLIDTLRTNWNPPVERAFYRETRKISTMSHKMKELLDRLGKAPPYVRQRSSPVPTENFEPTDEMALASYLPTVTPTSKIQEDPPTRRFKPGDIVRTGNPHVLRRALPPSTSEQALSKVADTMAIIHDVLSNDRLYIEVMAKSVAIQIHSSGVKFVGEGLCTVLADQTEAFVGSYVQVLTSEERVRELPGETGWVHGMADTCGKTGRVVRIAPKNGDVLVQFGWGSRYYFKGGALLQSSPDKVVAQDSRSHKWMQLGTLAHVCPSRDNFIKYQLKYALSWQRESRELLGKYVVVKRVYIKAFSTKKIIQITHGDQDYFVNIKCLKVISHAKDRFGAVVQPGDKVKLIQDTESIRAEQSPEFGGWIDSIPKYAGRAGKLTHMEPSGGEARGIVVKIQFSDSRSFYLNPRVISVGLIEDTVVAVRPSGYQEPSIATPPDEDSTAKEAWLNIERIRREDIVCHKRLGEGAFGMVFSGEWTKDGRKKEVAVKKIKAEVTRTISIDELMREAETQYNLSNHPNIVSLYGVSFLGDLWMILEYVNGETLYDMLFPEKGPPAEFPFKRKVRLCLEMCNAIAFVHNKGYLHCDIKPLNMMVDRKTARLYILDFGITRFLGNTNLSDFATQYTNNVAGTLYYIPPECLQPDAEGKCRRPKFSADVWALGAVFYELFTRSHLTDNPMEFLNSKYMNNDAGVKAKLNKLPHPVVQAVSQALDFDHKARPTAQELAEFFHELMSSLN